MSLDLCEVSMSKRILSLLGYLAMLFAALCLTSVAMFLDDSSYFRYAWAWGMLLAIALIIINYLGDTKNESK